MLGWKGVVIMKKLISIAVAVAMLFTLSLPAMGAFQFKQYQTDFESATSYSWATLTNVDSVSPITEDWSEVVTKTYGTNTGNKALSIRTGASYGTEAGKFDTLSYGTIIDNPVLGNVVYSFDFMIDSAVSAVENHTLMNFGTVQLCGTTKNNLQVFRLIKRANGCDLWLPDGADIGGLRIPFDVWTRVIMAYSPETGLAKFTLTTNVDTASPTTASRTYQLAAANAHTGVDRITFSINRNNVQFYFDNIDLYSYESTVLNETTPTNGAQDFMPMDTISLKFNNEITALNLSIGAAPIPAASWVAGANNTYSYKPTILSWDTEYTLSGTVTDIYGGTLPVSLSFKTAPQPEKFVEIVGFYEDDNGDTILDESEKLTTLEDGTITAKIRFWQTQETSYTYFMGFYRDNGGKPEMIDVVADTVTSSEVSVDKTLQLTIPTEYSDCYIRLFFLNNMSDRIVLDSSNTVGDTTLR